MPNTGKDDSYSINAKSIKQLLLIAKKNIIGQVKGNLFHSRGTWVEELSSNC